MYLVYLVSVVLALVPALIAAFFREYVAVRKKASLRQELDQHNATDSDLLAKRGGADALMLQIDESLRLSVLLFPSVLLVFLYLAGFALCDAYVQHIYTGALTPAFPETAIAASRPLVFAFIGVYVFNLGTMVRRLYLLDLNQQVFWGAVNRTLLSFGLTLAVAKLPLSSGAPVVFFAIGFLANAFLALVLETAMKTAGIGKPKRDDLPVRMVRGINIWKEYRLEEEGIENVQNLATADVMELALRTHFGLPTLIDWIDQAILISRFGEKVCDLEAAGLNVSSVELAWRAPEFRNGDMSTVDQIAAVAGLNKEFVAAQLDSLYEDEFVRNLWTLWQTRPDYNKKPATTPGSPGAENNERARSTGAGQS